MKSKCGGQRPTQTARAVSRSGPFLPVASTQPRLCTHHLDVGLCLLQHPFILWSPCTRVCESRSPSRAEWPWAMALARTELVLVTQRLAQTLGDSTGRLGCGGGWDCGWWLLPPSGHEKRNDQKFGPGICESHSGLHLTRDFWGRVKVTPGQLCHCS